MRQEGRRNGGFWFASVRIASVISVIAYAVSPRASVPTSKGWEGRERERERERERAEGPRLKAPAFGATVSGRGNFIKEPPPSPSPAFRWFSIKQYISILEAHRHSHLHTSLRTFVVVECNWCSPLFFRVIDQVSPSLRRIWTSLPGNIPSHHVGFRAGAGNLFREFFFFFFVNSTSFANSRFERRRKKRKKNWERVIEVIFKNFYFYNWLKCHELLWKWMQRVKTLASFVLELVIFFASFFFVNSTSFANSRFERRRKKRKKNWERVIEVIFKNFYFCNWLKCYELLWKWTWKQWGWRGQHWNETLRSPGTSWTGIARVLKAGAPLPSRLQFEL